MTGPYSIIYADPPWVYDDKAAAGKRGASFKYLCMKLEDICALPVGRLAAKDSALFLWTTHPFLPVALRVMSEWGFTYKTVAFTWVKQNRSGEGLFMGMGNWTRSNPETCLLGVRGKPKRVRAGVHSVVMSPLRGHSQKPPEVRERILQLMGDLPRIELFARETAPGWASHGDQIENSVTL